MLGLLLRVAIVALAGLALVVPLPAGVVERVYSRGLYLAVQPYLTALSDAVPFAVFDLLVLVLAVLAVVAFVSLFRGLAGPRPVRALARFTMRLLVAVSIVYLAFLAGWGLNYRRQPLTAKLDFRSDRPLPGAVLALAADAAAAVNRLHDEAHHAGWAEWEDFPGWLGPAFARAQQDLATGRSARPGRPKPTRLTFFFSGAGVDGMTDPFALEVLVNRTLLPYERPFLVAHEWAHLAGYADESEASFLGWLTCLRGPVAAQYSGWLFLYAEVQPALSRADRRRVADMLAEGPRDDLRAIHARLSSAQPFVRSVSWQVYDRYLRANQIEHGVASYNRVVLLVLGTRFRPGWVPIRANEAMPHSGTGLRVPESRGAVTEVVFPEPRP